MLKQKKIILILLTFIALILVFSNKSFAADETQAIWTDTNFNDESGGTSYDTKTIDTIIYDGKMYVATAMADSESEDPASKIYIKSYDGENWKNVGEPLTIYQEELIEQMAFCKRLDGLYLFYSGRGFLEIKKLNSYSETWGDLVSITNVSGNFGLATEDNTTYITVIDLNESTATIHQFDGKTLTEVDTYFKDNGYIVEPKATLLNGTLYVGVREVGKVQITVYSYIDGVLTNLNSTIEAYSYTMSTLREKIYITVQTEEGQSMKIYTFDGSKWEVIDTEVDYGTPAMVIKENEPYILTSAWTENGKLRTYSYSKSSQKFVQEGGDVDDAAKVAQAIVFNENIYTIYQNGTTGQIMVKKKEYVRDYFRGDINQDNRVSIADAILGLKGLTGKETLTDIQKAIGDVNDDGRLSVADIIKILKFLTGKETIL